MALVSIVIPCYQAGAHLVEAVESALAQRQVDVEVIVVDDGSTDDATRAALCEVASLPRVRCFAQSNAGPAAARNRAVREAHGEFILPLDADDRFDPGYAAAALAAIRTSPDVGIVYCRAVKFGAEQGEWTLPAYSPEEMAIDNVIFCSGLYRKSDWVTVGGYDEALRHGMEDYEFWLRLIGLGRSVVQLPDVLFHYRIQPASRTTRFMAVRPQVIDTYARIFRRHHGFFAAHAETLFAFRFRQQHELEHLRHRYGRIDAILEKNRWLFPLGRAVNRFLAAWTRRR
jgi:glycosyltransferase involved in cell wall biosynthesis